MGNKKSKIIEKQAEQIQQLQSQQIQIVNLPKSVYQREALAEDEIKTLEIGDKEYTLKEKLGQGAFGTVYKAVHNGQIYAIKEIPVSKENYSSIKTEIDFIINIRKEYASKALPIIEIYGADILNERLYYSMELATMSLQDLFDKILPMNESTRLKMGHIIYLFVLRALLFLESIDYVHNDIKPDNFVVIESKNEFKFNLKLIDFGTVKKIYMLKSKVVTFNIAGNMNHQKIFSIHSLKILLKKGTIMYLAPEQFQDIIHKKSDIWSLGIMLYQLIYSDFPSYVHKGANGIHLFAISDDELDFPRCSSDFNVLQSTARKCLLKDLTKRLSASELYAEAKSDPTCNTIIQDSFTKTRVRNQYKSTISLMTRNGKACFICKTHLTQDHKYRRCNNCFKTKCLDCFKDQDYGHKFARCNECFARHRQKMGK